MLTDSSSVPILRRASSTPAAPVKPPPDLRPLRAMMWLYLALWVVEGALRKWVLPSMANPLLVIRDPLLLLMYGTAMIKGVFPRHAFIGWITGLGALAMFVSFTATTAPVYIELYGLRSGYLHLPLIFLLPQIIRREDMYQIGKWTLLLAAPMAALVLLQFRASAGSWLNAGAGEDTSMLESAFGHVRPSGTFSYTNGLTGFTSMTLAFFLQHLLEKRLYPRMIWWAAIPALLVLVVLSGSRAAAGIVALILCAVLFISLVQSRYRASSLKLIAVCGVAVFVIGSFAVFKEGVSVFSSRFGNAANVQTGFVGRFFETILFPLTVMQDAPWEGKGLGMGTNVAAKLLVGKRTFQLGEGEGARVLMESGPVIGSAYLLLRIALMVYVGAMAVRALRRTGATLPLLIFSGCFVDLFMGQFSQSTALGYATISAGLCLSASFLSARASEQNTPQIAASPPTADAPVAKARGRSAYAERLHREEAE